MNQSLDLQCDPVKNLIQDKAILQSIFNLIYLDLIQNYCYFLKIFLKFI